MMTKNKLIEILKSLNIPVNEGIQNDKDANIYPRIVFWDYLWDPILASGEEYDTNVTYQVSFFSKKPPHESKIKELKKVLKENGINPYIEHEFVQKERYFHSYFRVEIVENLNEIIK